MKKNLKTKLMRQIKKEEIIMKPRWWFSLKKISIKSIWYLLIVIGSILTSLVWYLIELINPKELIEFDEIGREIILRDFPYIALLITILVTTAAVLIFSQLENNYKLSRFRIWLTVLFIVGIGSLILSLIRILGLI